MTIKTERLLARAKKIAKKGDIDEAKKIFTMVLETSPHNQEAKNRLLALHQSKSQPGLRKTFRQLSADFPPIFRRFPLISAEFRPTAFIFGRVATATIPSAR